MGTTQPVTLEAVIRDDIFPRVDVMLEVVNAADGRLLKTATITDVPDGWFYYTWDGKDTVGAPAMTGSYFFRLRARDQVKLQDGTPNVSDPVTSKHFLIL